MKKLLSSYRFTAIQQMLFESGKLDGYENCISALIKRLSFAREMRCIELWCEYQTQVEAWCDMLQELCVLDIVERNILYGFIMENGKRDL